MNIQLYNDLIDAIRKLRVGEKFQINELCAGSEHYSKEDMPSIGRKFKEEVLAGNIPFVKHDSLKTDNHNVYKRV